jgi:hypothetical protein
MKTISKKSAKTEKRKVSSFQSLKNKQNELIGDLFALKSENLQLKSKISALEKERPTAETDFDKCIQNRLSTTQHLLLVKGKEYVRGTDRFHNFNRAAKMNNETPTRSLHGMLTKHLISMLDILDDIDKGVLPTKDIVDEKFGDIVVYVMLQEALIKEKFTVNF